MPLPRIVVTWLALLVGLLQLGCGSVGNSFTLTLSPLDGAPSETAVVDASFDTTTVPDSTLPDTSTPEDSSPPADSQPPPDTSPTIDSAPADTTGCQAGSSCDGGNDGSSAGPFTVSVTVSGLATGGSVVLQDNGTDQLTVMASGAATFSVALAPGAMYAVTVLTQPTGPTQTCVVTNGTGTVAHANVTTVTVACTTNSYTLGGTATGLAAGDMVVLGAVGQTATVSAGGSGTFTFPTPIVSGTTYTVTVLTAPATPAQTCTVGSGSGTIAGANVTNVTVSCVTGTFAVGGTLSGLAMSDMVVLQDNAGDDLPLTANGAFMFPTQVASGGTYAVTVLTQPSTPPQSCTVSAGMGTVNGAAVTNVVVNCGADLTIGGTMVGLASGDTVQLQNNGGDTIFVTTNGSFAFATTLPTGAMYDVTVLANPTLPISQTCSTSSVPANLPMGTVGTTNVTSVTITCVTNTFTIGGAVSGVNAGVTITLLDNGGDSISANSSTSTFTFATPVASGHSYSVTVTSPSEPCTVSGGSGLVTTSNVTNVVVTCGCDPTTEVTFNGQCYYLDGSLGVCDPGYSLASNATMAAILAANPAAFQGLNYRHAVSGNCCMIVADGCGFENYGMPIHCNSAGPFNSGEPALGAIGCTMQCNLDPGQLTFCGN